MSEVDLRERAYVSRFSNDPVGLVIHKAGAISDADANLVTVTLLREVYDEHGEDLDPEVVFVRTADREDVGVYSTILSSVDTSVSANYIVRFEYGIDAVPQIFETYLHVGEASPTYDNLANPMKEIVDNVWMRFADLFDSPDGGPNLLVYFQSHYGRGRLAQLLRVAVGLLNTTAQPYQTYTIDGDGGASFPTEKWGPLLESALYVEAIKHLIRSYTEQPLFMGAASISRQDRRDYMDRWRAVLDMEQPILRQQLQVFKISNMGLGRPRVLVSGGIYGRWGLGVFRANSMAARPRYYGARY